MDHIHIHILLNAQLGWGQEFSKIEEHISSDSLMLDTLRHRECINYLKNRKLMLRRVATDVKVGLFKID